MSSSMISSPLIILLILSILLLFSTPTHATSSSTLIKKVCSAEGQDFTAKSCTRLLECQPMVVSATTMVELSVGIIKSGISRSTSTHTYIKKLLKKHSSEPNLKGALKKCNWAYSGVFGSLRSALIEIGENESQPASYDLLIAGIDDIRACEKALASIGMNDKIISRGNKVIHIFALSAFQAVITLPPK